MFAAAASAVTTMPSDSTSFSAPSPHALANSSAVTSGPSASLTDTNVSTFAFTHLFCKPFFYVRRKFSFVLLVLHFFFTACYFGVFIIVLFGVQLGSSWSCFTTLVITSCFDRCCSLSNKQNTDNTSMISIVTHMYCQT